MMAALAVIEQLYLEIPWRVLLGCYESCSLSSTNANGRMQQCKVQAQCLPSAYSFLLSTPLLPSFANTPISLQRTTCVCVFQSTQPGVSLPICRRKCFITSERALICFIFHGHIHRKVRRILCIMTPKPAVSKGTAVKTMQSISYYCKQIHKKSFLGYPQHSFYFTVACMLLLDGV